MDNERSQPSRTTTSGYSPRSQTRPLLASAGWVRNYRPPHVSCNVYCSFVGIRKHIVETEETHFLQLSRSTAADIVEKASAAAFGQPLVANYLRSQIVEAMVAEALAPEWKWVSASWAGWDFQSEANDKLEVKQSAAKQTWAPVSGRNVKSS